MENVNVKVQGDRMIIEVDLSKRGRVTKSGKSIFVADTNGFAKVDGKQAEKMQFSLNVIVPNPDFAG